MEDSIKKIHSNINHICLLGASFNEGNQGVGALTAGAIKCIYHQYPNAKISLLDYGKEKTTYHLQGGHISKHVELVCIRFSKKFYLKNNIALLIIFALILKIIPFRSIRKKIIATNDCLSLISNADIVVSVAGGDSFSDIYGLARFLYVSLPQIFALLMGKTLVLLPQTLGPFNRRITKAIARSILNRATLIYSRDHNCIIDIGRLLGAKNSSGKVKFCYDVGFVIDPINPLNMDLDGFMERKIKDSCVVGLNISGLLFMGGYTHKNMFGLNIDYREFIYEIIDKLILHKQATVLLIPHVFGFSEDSESDAAISKKIYAELKNKYDTNIFLAQGSYNQNEIKYIIGHCDFFIGSRMHACIAALSQYIPTVAIAYSMKFLGVMQSIGAQNLVADARNLTKTQLFTHIDDLYSKRITIHEELKSIMPNVRETILNLFNDIEKHVN